MTTAHRPTFKAAVGGSEQGGNKLLSYTRAFSAKDLPAYLELKTRQPGQGTQEELENRDFRQDLLKREQEGKRQKDLKALGVSETSLAVTIGDRDVTEPQIFKKIKPNVEENLRFPEDVNDEAFMQSSGEEDSQLLLNKQDKNNQNEENQRDSDKEEDDDADNDDDDDEELLREFQKIKEQKEQDEKKRFQLKQESINMNKEEELLKGNPLLAGEDYSLKKKWYEDTIFRNQARLEKKDNQRFINDAVRSDFHRKFLNRYIMM